MSLDGESLPVAVIPAFNAGPWIRDVVTRTLSVLPDVLVIDDGSVDDTADVARSAGADVVSHAVNRGKGAALRTAFDSLFAPDGPSAPAVVTLDADGQHLPEEIPKLVAAWRDGADLVLGTRDHLFASMSRVRRASNSLSSRAISWAAGRRLGDIQTGFRIYTPELLDATGFPEDRFQAESAVVVRAARRGFRIVSVPVELGFVDGRHTSHYRPLVDSLRIAVAVTRARYEKINAAG